MSKKTKNRLVGAVAVLCLLGAAERLYKAYKVHWPVAEEGECLLVNNGKFNVRLEIVKNDNKESVSELIVCDGTDYGNLCFYGTSSYQNLRNLNPKKIGCDEKIP